MEFLNNYNKIGLVAVTLLCLLSQCNSCRQSRQIDAINTKCDSLQTVLQTVPTRDELNAETELQGLEASKRTLYDWNAVVRTAVRPDDRMAEYDKQISALRKKLK